MNDDKQQQLKIELLSQWKLEAEFRNSGFNPAISYSRTLILAAGWLRLKCEELESRYRRPSRAEIAKMGGDDDREDKERVMAGFLDGSVR